jgi:hypothetical protein
VKGFFTSCPVLLEPAKRSNVLNDWNASATPSLVR